MNWKHLIYHPFWENKLVHLMPIVVTSRKSTLVDESSLILEAIENEEDNDRVNSMIFSTDRPKTTASTILDQKQPEMNVSFSIR
jgi:hypothetical protein